MEEEFNVGERSFLIVLDIDKINLLGWSGREVILHFIQSM